MKRLLLLAVVGCAQPAQIPVDPPRPVSIPPAAVPAPELDDAAVIAKSHEFLDTIDRACGFKTQPNQLLVDSVKGVKPGTALDLATGQGRNSVFLSVQGWKTTGLDVSKEGLRQAREQAEQKKVKLETIEADMETYDLGRDRWDLVTMIYCGTSKALVEKIKPSLKKGGLFVTEYFHEDSDAAKSGAGGWKTGELKALFADGFEIVHDDVVDDIADWTQRKQKLVRFVARKK